MRCFFSYIHLLRYCLWKLKNEFLFWIQRSNLQVCSCLILSKIQLRFQNLQHTLRWLQLLLQCRRVQQLRLIRFFS